MSPQSLYLSGSNAMLAQAVLVFFTEQPRWNRALPFDFAEGLFEPRLIDGLETVPVPDAVLDGYVGVGAIEVVEVQQEELGRRKEVTEQPSQGCFARARGPGDANKQGRLHAGCW